MFHVRIHLTKISKKDIISGREILEKFGNGRFTQQKQHILHNYDKYNRSVVYV